MPRNTQQELVATRQIWDQAAATFDDEPDHGLRDPSVRRAWLARLSQWLPAPPATVLDIGCGTGSLSLLLAEMGHQVTGVDLSPAMVARAQAKTLAAGHQIPFQVMDAANPQLPARHFNVLLCRHLLWALPDLAAVLRRWVDLVEPGGRLVLVEGYWQSGGLHARQIVAALPTTLSAITVEELAQQPELWGRAVTDERYAIIAAVPDDRLA